MRFDVCIQKAAVKTEVLPGSDYSCMVLNGPIPPIRATNAVGVLLLSGILH